MTEPIATPPPLPNYSTIFDGVQEAIDELGPPKPLRFFATGKGWYLDKNTFFGRVIHPVKENPFVPKPDYEAQLWYDIRPIPAYILCQAWGFFRAAWNARKSEAMVYLLDVDGTYTLHIPKQHVTGGHVNAKLDPHELPTGAQIVGDLHSHCNFGAFHSGTDEADARKNDGLHVTVGHVDADIPEWAVMLAYSGFLWHLKPNDITDTLLTDLHPIDPPAEWLARIDEPAPVVISQAWQSNPWYAKYYGQGSHQTSWRPTDEFDPWEPYVAGNYTPDKDTPLIHARGWNSVDDLIDSTSDGELTEYDLETLEYVSWRLEDARTNLLELGYDLDCQIVPLPYQDDDKTTTPLQKEIQA